jgi:hypothetical protein
MGVENRVEAAIRQNRRGAVCRTLGWLLLGFDFILAAFVFVGLRTGSEFWLHWVIIEGALGLILLGVGSRMQSKAAIELLRQSGHLRPDAERYRKAG